MAFNATKGPFKKDFVKSFDEFIDTTVAKYLLH